MPQEPDWEKILNFLRPRPPLFIPQFPTPKQAAFLRTNALEVLFGGSSGPGKSSALLMAASQFFDVPGYAAIIFRKTYSDLALPGALMDRAHEWWDELSEAHWSSDTHTWTFPSGASLTFGYMDTPNAHLRYKSCRADGSVEVLTNHGWEYVEKVQEGDVVASLNPRTRELEFKPVLKTWSYYYNGDLIEGSGLKKSQVDFSVTPEHIMWASTYPRGQAGAPLKPFRAGTLPKTATMPQWADWNGSKSVGTRRFEGLSEGCGIKTPDLEFSEEDWLRFMGWWISEGEVVKHGRKGYKNNTIKIHQTLAGKLDLNDIKTVLERCGARATFFWDGTKDVSPVKGVKFSNPELAQYLDPWRGCHQKRIPRDLLGLSREHSLILMKALNDGDGCYHREKRQREHLDYEGAATYVTSSDGLADDVTELAVYCGWRAKRTRGVGQSSGCWYIGLVDRRGMDTKVTTRRVPYEGMVACFEVADNHTFLTRYNDRVCWVGNSAEFQFVGWDELTELSERSYRYLFSRLRRPSGRAGLELATVPLRMRSASNPAPNWVRRYFLEEGPTNGRLYIPALLKDNIHVDQKSYMEALDKLDEVDKARLIRGDWYAEESGSKFSRDWFPIVSPNDLPNKFENTIRAWDLAATVPSDRNPDPDFTVGAKVGLCDGKLYILDIRRTRADAGDIEKLIAQTAAEDGPSIKIRMEQEPGASGVNTISNYSRYVLLGYDFDGYKTIRDKNARADIWASKAKRGEIILVRGDWITKFLDEAVAFDGGGSHDDQIDAVSTAVELLTGLGQLGRRRLEIIV